MGVEDFGRLSQMRTAEWTDITNKRIESTYIKAFYIVIDFKTAVLWG